MQDVRKIIGLCFQCPSFTAHARDNTTGATVRSPSITPLTDTEREREREKEGEKERQR